MTSLSPHATLGQRRTGSAVCKVDLLHICKVDFSTWKQASGYSDPSLGVVRKGFLLNFSLKRNFHCPEQPVPADQAELAYPHPRLAGLGKKRRWLSKSREAPGGSRAKLPGALTLGSDSRVWLSFTRCLSLMFPPVNLIVGIMSP